jgi:Ca2+-binding EF-hand superfamily protein
MNLFLWCVALGVAGVSANVVTADRQEYNKRSAERYVAMFRMNDVDADNVVSRHEARTTIELAARFDDIDINRDGYITWVELTRYIETNFR